MVLEPHDQPNHSIVFGVIDINGALEKLLYINMHLFITIYSCNFGTLFLRSSLKGIEGYSVQSHSPSSLSVERHTKTFCHTHSGCSVPFDNIRKSKQETTY